MAKVPNGVETLPKI